MKNLELRSSLIKSGILLGLCIFLIYAFAAESSGGIGGTIASLFSGFTFLIGLTLALVISVLVIFGVYFGILYLYDPKVSQKTYGELKANLTDISSKLALDTKCCTTVAPDAPATTTVTETANELESIQATQSRLTAQLANTDAKVDSMQKALSTLNASLTAVSEQISAFGEQTQTVSEELETKASTGAIEDSAKKLGADINSLKTSMEPLSAKLSSLEETVAGFEGGTEGKDDDIQAIVDQSLSALQDELKAVKDMISEQSSPENESDDSSPRILTYFSKKADRKKFIALVKESVKQDMTYAQIDEVLNESLSKESATIIADHPSLTKDYIRDCRQGS